MNESLSLHRGHDGAVLLSFRSVVRPVGSNRLDLGVKLDARLAVKVKISPDRVPRTSEGKEGKGHGNRNVDAHLPDVDFVLKLASGGARLRENRRSVAVRV